MFYILFGGIMLILGLLVHKAKLYFLISGYNTYSREKQENVDVESTAKLIGYYGYVNAAVLFATGALDMLGVKIGMIPPIIFMMVSTMILLWKIQKYDGNVYDDNGQMKKSSKVQFILVILILGGTFLFVCIMMFASSRDTSVRIDDQGIEIEGMYGDAYEWSAMEKLSLLSDLPGITLRTNGSAIGSKLRGHFRMDEFGAVMLFMDASVPPYIYFETNGKPVIFNLGDREKTEQFFERMQAVKP